MNHIHDSGANPTRITNATPRMRLLKTRNTIYFSTSSTSSVTHYGTLKIKTNTTELLTLRVIANLAIPPNFIFVHEIALKYGAVLFRPHDGAIVPTHNYPTEVIGSSNVKKGSTLQNYHFITLPVHRLPAQTRSLTST